MNTHHSMSEPTDGSDPITHEPIPEETNPVESEVVSRRRFGRRLLAGIPFAVAAAALLGQPPEVAHAGTDGDWSLTGNALPDATKFLGTTNAQALTIKTTNAVRMTVAAGGNVGIGISAPTAKLQVLGTTTFGVRSDSSSAAADSAAMYGRLTTASPGDRSAGVRGDASAASAVGGLFRNQAGAGTKGVGLRALSASGSAADTAIFMNAAGEFAGPNGVVAAASSDSQGGYGVIGISKGTAGKGVYGFESSASGSTVGVEGYVRSPTGIGVRGMAPNSINLAISAMGVQGKGTVGVQGTGEYMGVQGSSTNYGIFGYTTPDTGGIGAYGRGAIGVKGRSYTGQAVLGDTDTGVGVMGESYGNGGAVKAIYGLAFGTSGNGVVGEANNGASAYGVWGKSSSGYAGVFSGKVLVTGVLAKGGGSFKIDHPLDPTNKYLYHSFVESPDMMNVYNGNITTDAHGNATVALPSYFEALNRDFRYQLTVIGQFAQAIVASKVANNQFTIKTDKPSVEVSWQVTGIRHDAFANANRIPVEEAKSADERGKYLHPIAYGKPETMSVESERMQLGRAQASHRIPDPKAPANNHPAPTDGLQGQNPAQ